MKRNSPNKNTDTNNQFNSSQKNMPPNLYDASANNLNNNSHPRFIFRNATDTSSPHINPIPQTSPEKKGFNFRYLPKDSEPPQFFPQSQIPNNNNYSNTRKVPQRKHSQSTPPPSPPNTELKDNIYNSILNPQKVNYSNLNNQSIFSNNNNSKPTLNPQQPNRTNLTIQGQFKINNNLTANQQQTKNSNFNKQVTITPKVQPSFNSKQPQISRAKSDPPNLTAKGQNNIQIVSTMSAPDTPPPVQVEIPKHYNFNIQGIQVKFPYEHMYEAQDQLISNSLKAFKTSQNALLESPTGTGKSLALLSAALSFIETCPTIMKVFYTSRTHIQLQQLVSEFKKLPYFQQMSILASKRHLCIVPQVAQSSSPDYECKKLCEEDGGCPYNNPYKKVGFDIEDVKVPNNNTNNSIPIEFTIRGSKPKFDLDDLKEYGLQNKVCPYQLAFNIYYTSKLVFCPYNYILKVNDNKNLLLDFPNNSTIAIFDEGHNIESTARDEATLSLNYRKVLEARMAAGRVPPDDNFRDFFNRVQGLQTDILNFIEMKRFEYDKKYRGSNPNICPKYLTIDSFKSSFVYTNEYNIKSIGDEMAKWLRIIGNNDKSSLREKKIYVNDTLVNFFFNCADVLMAIDQNTLDFYRIVFVPNEKGIKQNDEFRLLCLKPAFLFERINKKAKSIIIASGTLSPLDSFAAELESSFPFKISAPHVVDPSQVRTISINSYKNVRITSRFTTLQSCGQDIYNSLSHIIATILKTVPGGSLFFAPSYYTKSAIIRQWKSNNMYDSISNIKPIVEEEANLPAKAIIDEFKSYQNGALLIGVCRGKVSEGIDFSDDLSRIVFVFGIPYPAYRDANVELKMKYNDIRHSTNSNYLSGSDWYTCQAFRALFQSVGRCLRHTSDYGAIVFLDERIESNIEKLPKWLKIKSETAENAVVILSNFYREMRAKFPSSSDNSFSMQIDKKDKPHNTNTKSNSFSYSISGNQKSSPILTNSSNSFSINLNHENSNPPHVLNNDNNNDDSDIVHKKKKRESFLSDDSPIDDFQFDYDQVFEPQVKESRFQTKIYCDHCRALAMLIKDLEVAKFKTIDIPEVFQLLDMDETKAELMHINESEITERNIEDTKSIFSRSKSISFTKKQCVNCGMPLGVIVDSAPANSEFQKGEVYFRLDTTALKIDGETMSLYEIASNPV